ncbi:hypothetical protein VPNG_04468 [Cytospora leucostoma]|uniref:Transcription initiation factor IIE subunit beta n=1 Tax=Cytospora leucostoma TaxID=1230097 RepID=A0A423XBW6_9PEZI|nr:hypothetical protein VPNG_04468 [Cytospora leucostoma]
MSFLERQRAATAAAKNGPAVVDLTGPSKRTSALAPPSPSPSVASTSSAIAGGNTPTKKNKSRPGDGVDIFSQPSLTGTGQELGTQMVYAVNHLKEKDKELGIHEIMDHLTIRVTGEAERAQLAEKLRANPRVRWIPDPNVTEQRWDSGTYVHNPVIPGVRSKESLLAHLQRRKDAMYVQVKDLEDGWPKERLYPALAELEAEHRVLVVRTKKDNHPRFVWSDDASLWHHVDPEFQAMWHRVQVPPADEINRLLTQAGQKPTSEDPRLRKQPTKVEKKKKKAARRPGNITNTHLLHLLEGGKK